jgi:exonuclease I
MKKVTINKKPILINASVLKPKYAKLLNNIGATIETARQNAVRAINIELVKANFEIGRHIVEFEQQGNDRAEYGSDLLASLSKDLTLK